MTHLPGSFGPLWAIDGPPPQPPARSLLTAARIVPDADAGGAERWGNGVEVYPYPPGPAGVHDACATGSDRVKQDGGLIPLPQFGAMTVYLSETCSSLGIFGEGLSNAQAQDRFVARARTALAAVESQAVEREFFAGDVLGLNPFLADGNGTFPNANTATNVTEAFALLEAEIASVGGSGMIHCSPRIITYASLAGLIIWPLNRGTQLYTLNGTLVVPGQGYVDDSVNPAGHSGAGNGNEWIYATGLVDIRRSDYEVLPDSLFQALDRETNLLTYRVERTYLVDWDTVLQSAVLVDRSQCDCAVV
jgi:hypothetical protein